MAVPIGIYNLFYQPGNIEYYLTLDLSSQFQPSISVLIPGAKSQQWQVSGDQGTNLRAVCSVSAGSCIGRSASNLNATLVEPTPVPWYLAASPFGPGWYKFSATANDAGPWWDVGVDSSSGTPETLLVNSGGWNIFFFRPVQADLTITSLSSSSNIVASSTATTAPPATQNNTSSLSISFNSTTFASSSITTSISTGVAPATTTGLSTTTTPSAYGGNSNALSRGEVAGLASSIPLGVLGLLISAWGVWFAMKQQKEGKPVMRTLVTNIHNVFHPHPPRSYPRTDHAADADGRA